MRRINTYIIRFLKFLISSVKEVVVALIVALLLPIIYSKWGELHSYWRILQDALRSGYVRGIPFPNAEGWSVAWTLGGPPLIHVAIPYLFIGISLTLGILVIGYLLSKYYSFRKLKQICTYLRNPKNFRKTISIGIVIAVSAVCFLTAFIGTSVDPKIIAPNLKPAPNHIGVNVHLSASVFVTVTRLAIIRATPSVLEKEGATGCFYCIIQIPENASWSIFDIDKSSIVLNNVVSPDSIAIREENGTSVMITEFDKGALFSLSEDQNAIELGKIILTLRGGLLKEREFFQGSTTIEIIEKQV